MFKKDEYISLQALVECEDFSYFEDAIGLHNNLKFFHRIQNTEDIEVGEAIVKKKSWKRFLFSLFVFTLLFFSLFLVIGNSYKRENIVYREVVSNREYYAYLVNDSTVALQKRNTIAVLLGESSKEMPISEFLSRYRPLYIYEKWNPNFIANITMICIVLLFVISILLPEFVSTRRNNKLYSLYHTLDYKK